MKKFFAAVLVCLQLFSTVADARPHRHHHRLMTGRTHVTHTAHNYNRPRECMGIPWCGCWLRHQFGLADKSLNLAAAWMRFPKASIDNANIVVWPSRHHVGKLLGHKGDRIEVISGNAGRNSGIPIWIKWNGRFSFHKL